MTVGGAFRDTEEGFLLVCRRGLRNVACTVPYHASSGTIHEGHATSIDLVINTASPYGVCAPHLAVSSCSNEAMR